MLNKWKTVLEEKALKNHNKQEASDTPKPKNTTTPPRLFQRVQSGRDQAAELKRPQNTWMNVTDTPILSYSGPKDKTNNWGLWAGGCCIKFPDG